MPRIDLIQQRRGTAAQWTAANPVLAAGEIGFETDTGKHKIGDGASVWSVLDYFLPESALNAAYLPRVIVQGVGDGATDDLAAFQAARTLAGAAGLVHFPAKPGATTTTYFLAGVRPDLTGTNISADPTVIIKVDEDPETKDVNWVTPVTIENPDHVTTWRKPAGIDVPIEAAIAANAPLPQGQPIAENMKTAAIWTHHSVTGAQTLGAGTGTVNAGGDTVTWGAAFASGQEGVYRRAVVGAMWECLFNTTQASVVTDGFVTAEVLSNPTQASRYDWSAELGAQTLERRIDGAVSAALAYPGNGDAYTLPLAGSVVLGLRLVTARLVEIYVNGVMVDRVTLPWAAYRIGFTVSADLSGTTTIQRVVRYDQSNPASQRHVAVSIIGDSLSYGAWSPLSWDRLLPIALAGIPGGGGVTINANHAVSGTSSAEWRPLGGNLIGGVDLTGDDYTLVMLGTNDVQQARNPITFLGYMGQICAEIVAQGSRPVVGIFPIPTTAAISGVTGVVTTDYQKGAIYRHVLVKMCADNGYPCAQVNDLYGLNLRWYNDNIHPQAIGLAAVAKAFALAIAADNLGDHRPVWAACGAWTPVTAFLNSWGNVGSAPAEYRILGNGDVELRGAVAGGTPGTTSVAFNLPAEARPPRNDRQRVAAVGGGVELSGTIQVEPDGDVVIMAGDTGFTSVKTRFSTL